jgi:hypothetical protein
MSSIAGSFQSCADGNRSTSLTCSGPSCGALQKIPGLSCTNNTSGSITCTNGNKCAVVSNLTSSFALQGNGLIISQSHNITINSQNFTLIGTGAKFTNTTSTTAAHSAAHPFPKPSIKWLMLIVLLLFPLQSLAATPISTELAEVITQYTPVLEGILEPLQVAMCYAVTDAPTDNLFERALLEFAVLEVCLEDLMITLLGLVGELVEDANSTAYGSALPINDPETLFTAAAGDTILCLEVAQALLNDPSGNTATQICAPILANAPATTVAIPSATLPASTQATSSALPPGWPSSSIFSGNGSCPACRLSQFIIDIQQYTVCDQTVPGDGNPYAGLNITNPPVTSYGLVTVVCDSEWRSLGFQAACDYMCQNNVCNQWSLNAVIASMGSYYAPPPLGPQPTYCNDVCSTGDYLLGLNAPYCSEPVDDTCECGTGWFACYPLNPKTGACYIKGDGV